MRAPEYVSEGAVAVAYKMMLELIGVPPDGILIARRAPEDVSPYRQLFGYVPTFNAQQFAVAFPADLLTRPVRGADRERRRILEKSIASYWAVKQPSIAQSVVRILHALVVFPDATLERVADELSMNGFRLAPRKAALPEPYRVFGRGRYRLSRAAAPLAQRLLQEREAVGIEPQRGLQHRRFHRRHDDDGGGGRNRAAKEPAAHPRLRRDARLFVQPRDTGRRGEAAVVFAPRQGRLGCLKRRSRLAIDGKARIRNRAGWTAMNRVSAS